MNVPRLMCGLVMLLPSGVLAQGAAPSSTWDVNVGWQMPLVRLRDDAEFHVRRAKALSLGIARYFHADRPLLWRLSGSMTLGEIQLRPKRGNGFLPPSSTHHSARTEYALGVDAARRIFHSTRGRGSEDLRLYSGGGLRWVQQFGETCTLNPGCYLSRDYPERIPEAMGQAGVLATLSRPTLTTRLEVGYVLSNAWSVIQHDLRVSLGFSLATFGH